MFYGSMGNDGRGACQVIANLIGSKFHKVSMFSYFLITSEPKEKMGLGIIS